MATNKLDEGLRFVALAHRLRTLGMVLASLPVAAVLYRQHAPAWLWVLLVANGFLWPHLAWWHASRSLTPVQREQFNLLADATLLGMWIALMRFNLLPCALLVSMLSMDRISAGGLRLLIKTLLLEAVTCLVVAWLNGFQVQPVSDMVDIVACIPMLLIYPVWLSTVNFRFGRRVSQQNRLLEQLNRTDTLTGLANRAYWMETAALELQRFHRNQRPASLILLDVGGFKDVNDRHGHATGDTLLRELAKVLRDNLRTVDTPGRLGGDEFGIVLPETGIERARQVAERIRTQVECIGIDDNRASTWTLSLGVAEIGVQFDDVGSWIRQADVALYLAKSRGRNQVCSSSLEPALA